MTFIILSVVEGIGIRVLNVVKNKKLIAKGQKLVASSKEMNLKEIQNIWILKHRTGRK